MAVICTYFSACTLTFLWQLYTNLTATGRRSSSTCTCASERGLFMGSGLRTIGSCARLVSCCVGRSCWFCECWLLFCVLVRSQPPSRPPAGYHVTNDLVLHARVGFRAGGSGNLLAVVCLGAVNKWLMSNVQSMSLACLQISGNYKLNKGANQTALAMTCR